jgi:hypothetical protein
MEDLNLYALADPQFYEAVSRVPLGQQYVSRLKALLPPDWALQRWDVWVGATPPAGEEGPAQGFKIHVSSVPRHAARVLDLVVPELVGRRTGFKIAGDVQLHSFLLSKRAGRGGSGKFMTIYPPNDAAFAELLQALYEKTWGEDLAGPYILSDRRYRDSRILYYRYGGFHAGSVLKPDGTRTPVIRAPGGDAVPDERTPFFRLPPWVKDPFGGSDALTYEGERVLNGRWRIDSVISFSNSGGVYRATDERTGREAVVKEARPHSHLWDDGERSVDAVDLLAGEHRILQALEPTGLAAEPLDFFTHWEHAFLVQGVVAGRTFQQHWAHDRRILAPFVHRTGRIEAFVPRFRRMAAALIDAVKRIHERGVILGDLSPNNVLVNANEDETFRLGFIDFESALLTGDAGRMDAFARQWGTPGFADVAGRSARDRLGPEDDWYAVGMLLYGTVVPVQNMFALAPGARAAFMDRFVALGVPAQVRDVAFALLAGSPDRARDVLEEWEACEPLEEPAFA